MIQLHSAQKHRPRQGVLEEDVTRKRQTVLRNQHLLVDSFLNSQAERIEIKVSINLDALLFQSVFTCAPDLHACVLGDAKRNR
jgi:hypothetical protein